MKWWTFVLVPTALLHMVACSGEGGSEASPSAVTTTGFRSRVPEHVEKAVASFASGRVEIVGSLRAGPSEAALFWDGAEQTGWLALVAVSDGSWAATESEPLLLPAPEGRWGGFSSYVQIEVPQGRFVGGWVDPEADGVATTDENGKQLSQIAPESGGYILFDLHAEAVQVRSFRDRDLLGAVYVVPDVELDVVPEGIPDPDWQRRFIETVRRSPSDAEDLVPDELQPALLVRSLADLLTETPIVKSADRSVIHLDGPEREAVLFLHTYIIDGERWVVGYDYRPR